jgi:transforming growth factor-beta-induced protein
MAKTVVRRRDILDTALAAGHFFRFCDAAEATGLKGTLRSYGPFTVFAPTDRAFGKLGTQLLSDLLKPQNREALEKVMRYHVAEGTFTSSQVAQLSQVQTLYGEPIIITVRPEKTMIDTAIIVERDIECRNGIIHGIDAVMLPRK